MKCVICETPFKHGGIFCGPCGKSYDRASMVDGTIHGTIVWTARRIRRLDAKRRTDSATKVGGGT